MNTTTDALRDHYPLRMSHSYATVIHDLCDEVDKLRAENERLRVALADILAAIDSVDA